MASFVGFWIGRFHGGAWRSRDFWLGVAVVAIFVICWVGAIITTTPIPATSPSTNPLTTKFQPPKTTTPLPRRASIGASQIFSLDGEVLGYHSSLIRIPK